MKWDDLSLENKAEIMNKFVRSGISDLRIIRDEYNRMAEGGPFETFVQSLPENQRDSSNFNVRRYWELNGEPTDFDAAVERGMYTLNPDGYYHANSVAYNEDNDTYEFMKSIDHPSIFMELADYHSNPEFNKQYKLTAGKYPYLQYTPFAEGGKIHIKPENRGKFTALKERTGHSASWFKENGTPAQKKMATFALNAAKWHHAEGGNLNAPDPKTVNSPYYRETSEAPMYDYLRDRGLNHQQASALVGNMGVESYLNADLQQFVGGPAYGLIQAEGTRQKNMKNHPSIYQFGNNLSPEEQQQLDYVMDAGMNNYTSGEWGNKGYNSARDARKAFLNSTNTLEGSRIISRNYLRPGKPQQNRRDTMSKYIDAKMGSRFPYSMEEMNKAMLYYGNSSKSKKK